VGGGLQEAISAHSPLALPWTLSGLIDGPRQVEPVECCSGFLMTGVSGSVFKRTAKIRRSP
jgi:hypothetical protein